MGRKSVPRQTRKTNSTFMDQSKKIRVLVIEDEPKLCRLLRTSLEEQGYATFEAATAMEGVEVAAKWRPDAVLLDLDVTCGQGMAALQRLRESSPMPVLVMSMRNEEALKIAALDLGANDFLTRPFSFPELLARLRAALRLMEPAAAEAEVFRTGSLTVDFTRRIVKVGRRIVRLTATEYSLLQFFVRNAGKVVTHAQILQGVWGPKMAGKLECLRVYLTYLRKKLENNPAHPELLLTEPLVGYRLAVRRYKVA